MIMDEQDKATLLAGFTTAELVSEIKRRQAELADAIAQISTIGKVTGVATKSTARSEAAKKRWAATKAAGLSSLKDAAKAAKHSKTKRG
jgi:hypothetical protein